MRRLIAALFLFLAMLNGNTAQGTDSIWKSASEHYNNGDYTSAAMNYRIIEGENIVSSELYFNLGNCYYKLDSVANSILYYEKALKLNPRDDGARENLAKAINLIDDPIPSINQFFLTRWINWTSDLLPPMVWGILSLLALWFISWMLVRSVKGHTFHQDRIKYGVPVLVFLLSLFFAYVSYENQTSSDFAIVMESISVRAAPDDQSQVTKTIMEGEKVMILDKLEGYYKVRFVNYEHGWLPETAVRRI